MSRKAYLKHKTRDTNNLLTRRWHFCLIFNVTTMMAGKNQAASQKLYFPLSAANNNLHVLCWGLTSQSTIFQSCRDGATASWVINQYFRGVKCLAQGHNTAAVGFEPPASRSGVRHSTTEPPRSPQLACTPVCICVMVKYMYIRNCYAHLARPWNFKVSKTAVETFSNERVFYNVV